MKEPTPHPDNDGQVYGFNKNGFLRPKSLMGRPPRLDTPFAIWMKRRGLTGKKVTEAIRCSLLSVARWRRGGRILLPYAERLKARWPDCPVEIKRILPKPAWKLYRKRIQQADL